VQVGAAHTTRVDFHQQLAWARLGLGKLNGAQDTRSLDLHRPHRQSMARAKYGSMSL